MKSYQELLRHIILDGQWRGDRTGTGTLSVFGYQWRHKMSEGFPLLTTKKVHFKSVVYELLWFLKGGTNIKYLNEHGVTIWNEWADEYGELGPVYGAQWRKWKYTDSEYFKGEKDAGINFRFYTIDQIKILIDGLLVNPWSRRHIVTAWNPGEVDKMKLPPCHSFWQCYVSERGEKRMRYLSLHLYARSIDSFLGLPFNIASYALLLSMLAKVCNYIPDELIFSFGDLHIYSNHMEQVKEQLLRTPTELPSLGLPIAQRSIDTFEYEDVSLIDYNPQPSIKAPIAV